MKCRARANQFAGALTVILNRKNDTPAQNKLRESQTVILRTTRVFAANEEPKLQLLRCPR